ncbi:uncharacterized protein LOC116083532 [Mastomys coucha]|uniref:uncharacterized protein LOC116083532 n=1 Tax=Mastomys coucha TaxID=35658 RepID=UPI001261EE4D|nr:uncharacterized protein LOC116083532 [Mastomys coucha]
MAEAEAEEEEKKGEGSHRGSLVGEGPATENWIGVRTARLSTPAWQLMSPEAQGWCPCCCQRLSDTVHGHRWRSESQMHAKNQASISPVVHFHVSEDAREMWRFQGHLLSLHFTTESKKDVFSCHLMDYTLERKSGEQKRRRKKKMTTFESENRGLRFTTSSILGDVWWLILDTECGGWRSWLGIQKAVLVLRNKPGGISFIPSETESKLWFSAAFS